MTIRPTDSAAVRVSIEPTSIRQTAPTGSQRFREALSSAAGALLDGAMLATSVLPGGDSVSAAIRDARGGGVSGTSAALVGGEVPEAPGAVSTAASGVMEGTDLLRSSADQNMQFLQLQERMSAENRRYTALSNVLKARHETAKASINNIR